VRAPPIPPVRAPQNSVRAEYYRRAGMVRAEYLPPLRKTIGSIIRGFKIGVTKWMRQNTGTTDVWHRNYYEHIIRNEKSYQTISNYIANNPAKWDRAAVGAEYFPPLVRAEYLPPQHPPVRARRKKHPAGNFNAVSLLRVLALLFLLVILTTASP